MHLWNWLALGGRYWGAAWVGAYLFPTPSSQSKSFCCAYSAICPGEWFRVRKIMEDLPFPLLSNVAVAYPPPANGHCHLYQKQL